MIKLIKDKALLLNEKEYIKDDEAAKKIKIF